MGVDYMRDEGTLASRDDFGTLASDVDEMSWAPPCLKICSARLI